MEENIIINKTNIIIYDEKEMKYINGVLSAISIDNKAYNYQTVDGIIHNEVIGRTLIAQMPVSEETETIKLDETLMRRIAKYNKEVEIKKLDEIIEEKKKQVEELDNNLKDKEKRWKKVKEFVANIYEIELEDEEEDCYYDEEDIY